MNTVTAYARRARDARDAAREILEEGAPFTRLQDERAARLADYARRCDDLANIADGDRITVWFRRAGDYADAAHRIWSEIRASRRLGAGRS